LASAEHSATHPGVVALPIIDPEFWRQVNIVSIRGRRHSPAVGAIVREAMQKKRFGRTSDRGADCRRLTAPLQRPSLSLST